MNDTGRMRSGGQLLVDQLIEFGVDTVFGVPGESYLPVLDGLYARRDRIRMVVNRHEGGASFMADAYAKLTGKVGVCFVTRGPGAANAAIGIHTAQQDSTPLILFIGQVGREFRDRDAFQEVDFRAMFGGIAKWVGQIDRAERIPEYVARAFALARQGRMGPVVLALPEDVLDGDLIAETVGDAIAAVAAPDSRSMEELRDALASTQSPLLLLGGSGWTRDACREVRLFAEAHALPVVCSFRRQDLFDNRHPNYVGDAGLGINPRLAARIRAADLVIALNCRLSEVVTGGYSYFDPEVSRQRLIHIHPGSEDLGRVHRARAYVLAHITEIAQRLRELPASVKASRISSLEQAREEFQAWQTEPLTVRERTLNPWRIVKHMEDVLPDGTIVTNGAGNFATWIHRYWSYRDFEKFGRNQLAPTNGAMGYAIPAAVAAKIASPDRMVVAVTGDGDGLMTMQELATSRQYGAGIVVILFNNGMYGTIRMHQERRFPGRICGTDLLNPDFAALCRSFGGYGALVQHTDEFPTALMQALEFVRLGRGPAMIELALDPDLLSPNASLSSLGSTATQADA